MLVKKKNEVSVCSTVATAVHIFVMNDFRYLFSPIVCGSFTHVD